MMSLQTGAVQTLYTKRLSAYKALISFFRSQDAIRALVEHSGLLRPGLRVLVILLSSDFHFTTFGRAYRTMSFWRNAVPADHRCQQRTSIRSLVEMESRFCPGNHGRKHQSKGRNAAFVDP